MACSLAHGQGNDLTGLQALTFPPLDGLFATAAERQQHEAAIEQEYEALYEDLREAGTLQWCISRLQLAIPALSGLDTLLLLRSVIGVTWRSALQRYVLRDADTLIFCADARPHRMEATLETWENLPEARWVPGRPTHVGFPLLDASRQR